MRRRGLGGPWRGGARLVGVAVLLGGLLLAPAAAPVPGWAAGQRFTVNSTEDPGVDGCDEVECTLREAIVGANAAPGGGVIDFAIPGPGVHTIRPLSNLPVISERLTIDGYSQPGARPNTARAGTNARLLIEIDGGGFPGSGVGLDFSPAANRSVVRGLVVNRFNVGIAMDGVNGVVAGNFLGVDPGGSGDLGNRLNGVVIAGSGGGTIGGPAVADRNLISGNDGNGAVANTGVVVQNNLVGTDRSGTRPLGNTFDGVSVVATNVRVADNVVAFNAGNGVGLFFTPAPVDILGNAIFANDAAGIALNGGNANQAAPVLTAARAGKRATTVNGTLTSTPNTTFLVQVFANPNDADIEGKRLVAQREVTTDGGGVAAITLRIPARQRVRPGQALTATATATTTQPGATSAFSAPLVVQRGG
jgi:CSLREA domain-containing protein